MPVVQITEGTVRYEDEGQKELVETLKHLTRQLADKEGQGKEQVFKQESSETDGKSSCHPPSQSHTKTAHSSQELLRPSIDYSGGFEGQAQREALMPYSDLEYNIKQYLQHIA